MFGFDELMKNPQSYYARTMFMAQLMGEPVIKLVLIKNQVRKLLFWRGEVIPWNAINPILGEILSHWGNKFNFNGSIRDEDISDKDRPIIEFLVKTNILVPNYYEHPYHKIEPELTHYTAGRDFEFFMSHIYAQLEDEDNIPIDIEY